MFWDKGYAPSANIEALLEKQNVTVEEFLDEEDILQECKTQKKNIVNYFTRPEIIKRLVELITTEPAEDLPITQRFRYANMACEILTVGLPSLDEKLLSDQDTLKLLYSYLENEPPLNPLLSSFFSKTFSMLFTKKAEQDWFLYQQMCLQLLEYLKTQKTFLDLICKHFDTPVIPDLIMQMMKDVEGGQLKRNLYEWLTEDKLVERLIEILRNPQETEKHVNVADFFCDLIHQGRSMRQTEQENDSFEPAFDGSNPVLKNIESAETIEALLNVILEPKALESAIVSGITIVLTLIKPITFTDEPNSDRQKYLQQRERENHVKVQETVVAVIAPRLKEFVNILENPPNKPAIETSAGTLSPPFGKTRLQVCRVFTALLETKHETILKAICETEYFSLLLNFFKQYCWNNFLHSELEKALHIAFFTQMSNNNNLNSTSGSDNSYEKQLNSDDYVFNFFKELNDYTKESLQVDGGEDNCKTRQDVSNSNSEVGDNANVLSAVELQEEQQVPKEPQDQIMDDNENTTAAAEKQQEVPIAEKVESVTNANDELDENKENLMQVDNVDASNAVGAEGDAKEGEKTKVPTNTPPSELQTHLIIKCKLISKLIDFWQHNKEAQALDKGRRLGYMGHLIKIIKHITSCMSESEHISALIESNLSDETELELWRSMIDPEVGDFTKALQTQTKLLANCNPHDEGDYSQHLPKDFLGDNNAWDFIARIGAFSDLNVNDIVFTLDDDQNFQFGRNIDEDDDDDDENAAAGGGDSVYAKNATLNTLGNSSSGDPWDSEDPFGDISNVGGTGISKNVVAWGADFGSDNFADFDAHFSTFSNDLGLCSGAPTTAKDKQASSEQETSSSSSDNNEGIQNVVVQPNRICNDIGKMTEAEYDNNANVEKSSADFGKLIDTQQQSETPTPLNVSLSTSLVSRLQQVLLDGEEDYEDDEGMWTKPLGGSSNNDFNDDDGKDQKDFPIADPASSETLINGPNKQETEELNNAKNLSDQEQQNQQQTADTFGEKTAAPTSTNTIEIAPTTT